eukprot:10867495-Ditylum_brightwellii.AAC.2
MMIQMMKASLRLQWIMISRIKMMMLHLMRSVVLKRKTKKNVVSARKAHQGCKCCTDAGVSNIS